MRRHLPRHYGIRHIQLGETVAGTLTTVWEVRHGKLRPTWYNFVQEGEPIDYLNLIS